MEDDRDVPVASHVPEPRPALPPDVPDTVTLTYQDGRTVSLDIKHHPEVWGVVWSGAVEYLHHNEYPINGEGRSPTWIARTHESPEATICRWVNGQLICS